MRLPSLHKRQDGISLVELLIVMIITVLVTTVVLSFAIDFWGSSATLQNDLQTMVTRNDAGDSLRDKLNASSGLIMQNSLPDAHPMVPDPSDGTGQYWLTIHAVPGNIAMPASGNYTPVIYWKAPATDSSHNIILNGAQPYQNEFILYLSGSNKTLMLRQLANPGASGNSTITTCPPAQATTTCPADKQIADNISSIDMRYFSRSGNTIDYTSIVDPLTGNYIGPDFTAVEVVEFTLHLYKKSVINGAQDTSNSSIIRVAIRNR